MTSSLIFSQPLHWKLAATLALIARWTPNFYDLCFAGYFVSFTTTYAQSAGPGMLARGSIGSRTDTLAEPDGSPLFPLDWQTEAT
jgi:hypothetical protein